MVMKVVSWNEFIVLLISVALDDCLFLGKDLESC